MTPVPDLEEARAAAIPAMPGHTLAIGTRLRDYEITGLLGEGPWSVVYLAWDHSLQRKVAVKEYLPESLAVRAGGSAVVVKLERQLDAFKTGLKSFVNEARLLAGFDHPSLLKVYRFWEENGTAYMAMPCYEGPTLKTALAELGHVPSEDELRAWLKPILNAVTVLHDGGTWHQNIGPDEILLTPVGPVLLGLASAAHAVEATNHTPAAALKPGFAAIEQYGSEAGTMRGPWTDLYALAAVIYAAITGTDPAAAADRLAHDRLRPLTVVAAGLYSDGFLAAIDAAMAIQPEQRPADHAVFRALMGDIDAPEAVSLAPRRDLMQEPFVGLPASDREITVPDRPLLAGAEPGAASAVADVANKPRAAKRAAPAKVATAKAARATPSWMQASHVRSLGKRALYGIVAGTCALIGIAALVIQFATRPAPRATPAAAVAASTAATRQALAVAPAGPASTAAVIAPAAPATKLAASSSSTVAAVTRPAAPAVVPSVAAASTPARPAAVVASAIAPAPAPIAVPPVAIPVVPTATVDPRARCIEILQKASLEKITAAETDFFKRECK